MVRNNWKTAVLAAIAAGFISCAPRGLSDRRTTPVATSCRGVVDIDGRAVSADHVRWALLPESDDRERLDRSCGAVGPAVIAAPQVDAAPVRAALDDVAFVTWNVHGNAGDLGALVRAVRAGGRDRPPPAHIVLLLQEVVRAGDHVPRSIPPGAAVPRAVRTRAGPEDDVVAAVRALGMHVVYVPAMRNGRAPGPAGPEDRGNAIASTLPLSDVTAIELPVARHRRVAIAATIAGETGGGTWRARVVSAHLDTVGRWSSLFLFSSYLRSRQAARLIDVVGDADLVVMGADANSWSEGPAEPAIDRLRRALPDTPPPRWQPTFQGIWRLDYLFFRLPDRWRAVSRRLDSTFGSDHHAVIGGVVGLPEPNSAAGRPK
jgi:endonuclease/exonuclease/phosphatase family metal-dependent hydrolase